MVIPNLLKKIAAPALLLGVCLLAYGLQTPWLGYYLDDWIILAAYNAGGAERLLQYAFIGNRPLVFWIWWLGFELLGSAPLGWHLWTLLWRVLTVWAAWLALRELWPQHARRVLWAALLFAVYPLFFQQPTALTYSFHWICFSLYCISLYWLIRAVREPRRYLLFTSLAILSTAIQLFSSEFYVGLELLRPLIIFLALQPAELSPRKRLARSALQWGPYLALFCGYLLWRLVFMPTTGTDRNTPEILVGILTTPLSTLPLLVSMVLQDLAEGLVGVLVPHAAGRHVRAGPALQSLCLGRGGSGSRIRPGWCCASCALAANTRNARCGETRRCCSALPRSWPVSRPDGPLGARLATSAGCITTASGWQPCSGRASWWPL